MPAYIDREYYRNTFKGVDFEDNNELDRYIARASDIIDELTREKLFNKSLEDYHEKIQELVKKATAAQVEYYVMNGGPEQVASGANNVGRVQIGSFAYGSEKSAYERVSRETISFLNKSGLMYNGLDVVEPWQTYYPYPRRF